MSVDALNVYNLALEMIKLDARISIISRETGLSTRLLRKSYREIHNKSPSSGLLRNTPDFIYKTKTKEKQATVFCILYKLDETASFQRLINVYKRYIDFLTLSEQDKPTLLTFSEAWALSRFLDQAQVKLIECPVCSSARLITDQSFHVCPICKK
ncbi:MAG: FlhC family transcriptional regulator [Methylicorpusculum sp.]|uniref:FlhC family transcriptional regulator n=1 Tax=Methylicorpusculum sp. TaxID=2713644 RepID=UPI002718C28C|nr:FlhC family transcriptional regulator [Methylicorpusculum sp.]MDO8941069.1 FlhC family transcriptional regulator [Methylicorpusculum sp.]MDP2202332.1 FlhC family transcriptional regulator [Methylicorpusculum sp.]